MPGLSGLDVLAAAAGEGLPTKVVVLTASAPALSWPPNIAMSLTLPFTRTREPLLGVRPLLATTVISPVPSSTLYSFQPSGH